jgi:hypothetical protein
MGALPRRQGQERAVQRVIIDWSEASLIAEWR